MGAGMTGGDLSKVQAGPCEITLGNVSIGHTMEGVELNYEPELRERVIDALGSTAVELILVGESLEITTRMTQWELAKLKTAIPAGMNGTSYLGIGREAGYKLGSNEGAELVIHPLEVSGTANDVTIWNAVAMSPVVIGYNNEGDRMFEVTFKALADESKQDGQYLGKIGAT